MLLEHRGHRPRIAPSAYVAPTAVVAGDVTVGEESSVLFNAVVTAESGAVEIGRRCVVLAPIGWVAVGDPAQIFPPEAHEAIWAVQEPLDFPGTVFGLPRGPADELMPAAMKRYSEWLAAHRDDRVVDG